MTQALAYTRFEIVRTLRNARLLVFSLAFPLIIDYAIAGPNRQVDDFGATGISLPLYYMLGLVAFGTMMSLISTGARIATERTDGWTRQLRVTLLSARVPDREGRDGLRDGAPHDVGALRVGSAARRPPPRRALARAGQPCLAGRCGMAGDRLARGRRVGDRAHHPRRLAFRRDTGRV